jgi:glycosyltransferase involved in cell wall biosynthesis
MRIGFACAWDKYPEGTWSGTPFNLREALRRHTRVIDLGIDWSEVRTLLKYMYARYHRGRWVSTYQWSATWDRVVSRELEASLRKTSVDAVIEIGDLAVLDLPFYLYQDLSFDVLEKFYNSAGVPGFDTINLDTIKRRQDRQHKLYESAAGVFAMSEWFANTLVEWSGIPRHKVTVAYAGMNSIEATAEYYTPLETEVTQYRPVKLLFVGRDFLRKGGDIVLGALAQLRREYTPHVQLTVAGPGTWPLPGNIPDGVVFLGDLSTVEVARLYRKHDLFVMPSRFEAFGIVFLEALANGIPVIGRSAFAMPEIIMPGKNGALVYSDDPTELASTIISVLENPAVLEFTVQSAKDIRAQFSWDAVVERMLASITHSA